MKFFLFIYIALLSNLIDAKNLENNFLINGPYMNYKVSFDSANNLNFISKFNKEKVQSNKCSNNLINDIKKQFTAIFKKSKLNKGQMKSYYKITHNEKIRYLPLTSRAIKSLKKFPTRAMTLNKEIKYLCKK